MGQPTAFNFLDVAPNGLIQQTLDFTGRNVERVTFLFIPSEGQDITTIESGVRVRDEGSPLPQLLLNCMAHEVTINPLGPRMNPGSDKLEVTTDPAGNFGGRLYIWVNHVLTSVENCSVGSADCVPCQDVEVLSRFYEEWHSYSPDINAGTLEADQTWYYTGGIVISARSNGWIGITGDDQTDGLIQTFPSSFNPTAAPKRVLNMKGSVYWSVTDQP